MINFIAVEECPGCGVTLNLRPEVERLDFSGKSFIKTKSEEDSK